MDTLIGSEHYCLYRRRQYVLRNAYLDRELGLAVANIRLPEGMSAADFPEAIRSGGDGEDRWVVIPERLVAREWAVDVSGVWRGVEFGLSVLRDPDGPSLYGSTSDPAAGSLGMMGDQYNGWQGELPADEVVVTRQVERELPMTW